MNGSGITRFGTLACLLSLAVLGLTSHVQQPPEIGQGTRMKFEPDARPRGIRYKPGDQFSYVPYERAGIMSDANATAAFVVNYSDFSAPAQAAFQYAVNIWADTVVSGMPIIVDARFIPMDGNALGFAGPNWFWDNFPGAPRTGTFYPDAIADKLSGTDRFPGEADILAEFNSTPPVPWYFGLDARPPAGTVDFVSAVLHELGHGLGFIGGGWMDSSTGLGEWGIESIPLSYDRHVYHGSGRPFISNPSPSFAAAADLQSNSLFFASPAAADGRISSPARLFAPSPFEEGSSFNHLDEDTYLPGDPNALMTPYIHSAEANHSIGPIALEIFFDIGWGATGPGNPPTGTPGKPTITQAEASDGLLTVTWTDGVGAAPTSHRLDFYVNGAPATSVTVGGFTSIDISIPPGITGAFTVTVTAFTGTTPGSASDPFAFTLDGGGCTTASITSIQGGVANLVASVSYTGSGASSYIVQAGSVPGGANFVAPTNVGASTSVSAPVPAGFSAWVRVTPLNPCDKPGAPRDTFIQ